MRGDPRKVPELFCALIEAVTEDMHWRGDNGSVWSLNIWIDRGWSGHAPDVQFLLELSTSDIALYHFMGKIISKYDGHGARKCRRVSYVSRADYKMDLHTA